MKKKILGKLSLGKRSIATLTDSSMAQFNGGGYTTAGGNCNCSPGSGGQGPSPSDLSICGNTTVTVTIWGDPTNSMYQCVSTLPLGNVGCPNRG